MVDNRRRYMIINTAPIVPGEKNGRIRPIWTLHDGINLLGDKIFASLPGGRWMITGIARGRCNPRYIGQVTRLYIRDELTRRVVVTGRIECALDHQGGIPETRRAVISPAHLCVIEQLRHTLDVVARITPKSIARLMLGVQQRILRRGATLLRM